MNRKCMEREVNQQRIFTKQKNLFINYIIQLMELSNGEQELIKNIIKQFWQEVIQLMKEKKWKALLIKSKKILQSQSTEINPAYNLYAFLALYHKQDDQILKECFSKLLELELNHPYDLITKFNIVNYLMHFQKFEEAEVYFKELDGYLPNSFSVQFNNLLNEDLLYLEANQIDKYEDIIEQYPDKQKLYMDAMQNKWKDKKQREAANYFNKFIVKFSDFDLQTIVNLIVMSKLLNIQNPNLENFERRLAQYQSSDNYELEIEFFQFNHGLSLINSNGYSILHKLFKKTKNVNLKLLTAINMITYLENKGNYTSAVSILQQIIEEYQSFCNVKQFKQKLEQLLPKCRKVSAKNSVSEEENVQHHNQQFNHYPVEEKLIREDFLNNNIDQIKSFCPRSFTNSQTVQDPSITQIKLVPHVSIEFTLDQYYENIVAQIIQENFPQSFNKKYNKLKTQITGSFQMGSKDFQNLSKNKLIDQIEREAGNNLTLQYKLAYCYMEDNDFEMFKKCLLNIFSLNEDFKTDSITFSLGQIYYMTEEYDKALFFFSLNFKKECQNKDESLFYMAKIFVKQNLHKKALLVLEKLSKIKPNFTKGLYWIGKVHFIQKDFKEALKTFETVLQRNHSHFKALTFIGIIKMKIFLNYKDKKEALNFFDRALEISDINDKFRYTIHLKQALFYEEFKNVNYAIKYKEQAIKIKPNNIELVNSLVQDYLSIKKFQNAISVLKKSFKLFPQNHEIAMKLGSLYAYLGNFKKSSKYFIFILNNDQDNYEANLFLGKIYRDKLKKFNLSIKHLMRLSQTHKKAVVYYELGLSYFEQEDFCKMIQCLEESIHIDPQHTKSYHLIALHYINQEDFLNAKQIYEKVLQYDENDEQSIKGVIQCNLKLMQYELNLNFSEMLDFNRITTSNVFIQLAQSAFLSMVKNQENEEKDFLKAEIKKYLYMAEQNLQENNIEYIKEIAYLYYKINEFGRGLELLKEIRGQVNDPEFYYQLALGFFRQKEMNEAFKYLRNSIHQDHNNPNYQYLLAQIFIENKHYDKAVEILELLKVSYPNYKKIYFLLAEIYQLMQQKTKVNEICEEMVSRRFSKDRNSIKFIIKQRASILQNKENIKQLSKLNNEIIDYARVKILNQRISFECFVI